jgi:cell division protein FtsQ
VSKKKEPDNLPSSSSNDEQLTPWQKANRMYLNRKSKKKSETENDDSDQAVNESEEPEETKAEEQRKETTEAEVIHQEKDEENEVREKGPYNGSFVKRLPNLKSQRNKVLFRRLSLIITVLLIPLLFFIYYVSPYSKLAAVDVSGNSAVSSQAVKDSSNLSIGKNFWPQYWHKQEHIDHLKQEQPRIKDASITISSMNHFKLSVSEYKEVALVENKNEYSPVLENGTVLEEKVENPTKNLPILEGFDNDKKIKQLMEQYNKLSSELQKAISEIKYTPTSSNKNLLRLYMNDGNQVIINITNLPDQMKYYSQVAKEMDGKGTIDMEVGIFSYPNESTEETDQTEQTEQTTPATENELDKNE